MDLKEGGRVCFNVAIWGDDEVARCLQIRQKAVAAGVPNVDAYAQAEPVASQMAAGQYDGSWQGLMPHGGDPGTSLRWTYIERHVLPRWKAVRAVWNAAPRSRRRALERNPAAEAQATDQGTLGNGLVEPVWMFPPGPGREGRARRRPHAASRVRTDRGVGRDRNGTARPACLLRYTLHRSPKSRPPTAGALSSRAGISSAFSSTAIGNIGRGRSNIGRGRRSNGGSTRTRSANGLIVPQPHMNRRRAIEIAYRRSQHMDPPRRKACHRSAIWHRASRPRRPRGSRRRRRESRCSAAATRPWAGLRSRPHGQTPGRFPGSQQQPTSTRDRKPGQGPSL